MSCFSKSAKRSDKGSHTQLLLNRIYAPSHLQRGGVPKMSNEVAITRQQWSQSKKARTRRTSQNQVTLSDLKWTVWNHNEKEERAGKIIKKEKLRGRERIEAKQRQRNLVSHWQINKEGASTASANNISSSDYWYSIVPGLPCRESLIFITAWRPQMNGELLRLLALAMPHSH